MPTIPSVPVLALALLASLAGAQGASPPISAPQHADSARTTAAVVAVAPSLEARPVSGAIRIDGILDEAAWSSAPVATNYVQRRPNDGAPSSQRTEARVLYGDDAIYIGVRLFDTHPDSIASQLARRDATGIYSDWNDVIIDSYHDRRTAFRFSVNPHGVKKDVRHYDDDNEDLSWDAVWDVATSRDAQGWVAEYRIPFSQLRFGGASADGERVWGVNFIRSIARRGEQSSWSPMPNAAAGFVSRFGELRGLRNIPNPSRLEMLPYVTAKLDRAPGSSADPFYRRNDVEAAVGGDFKYAVTPGLSLNGTINPDFGQVEVDPAVVNLSAFETFFDERRPFFVEGRDIFQFGSVRSFNNYGFTEFFYSRRVGRSPSRFLETAYVDAPEATTILGALKLSGKTQGGWSVGVLDAVTAEEKAAFIDGAGDQVDAPIEPLTNYFVGRARKDMNKGMTNVGTIATAVNRRLDGDEFDEMLRSRAFLSGVDFEHNWNARDWTVSGFIARSDIVGSDTVIARAQRSSARYFQRPDQDHLEYRGDRSSLSGYNSQIGIAKGGGKRWVGSANYADVSPGFETNDIGFQGNADRRSLSTLVEWHVMEPSTRFRHKGVYAYQNYAANHGGDKVFEQYAVGWFSQLTNFWSVSGQAATSPRYFSDRLTRGGPMAEVASQWRVQANIRTDSRKPVVLGSNLAYRENAAGEYGHSVELSLDMRPTTFLRVMFNPFFSRGRDTDQFVRSVGDTLGDPAVRRTYGRRYVFASIDETDLALNTRVNWTFTPNLTLEMFLQPFIVAADYHGFKEFRTPRKFDFDQYGKDGFGTITKNGSTYTVDPNGYDTPFNPLDPDANDFTFGDPDFTLRSLRGNAVVRWEYRPGSTLFFVWQHLKSPNRTDDVGRFDAGEDIGALLHGNARDVFAVKATFWVAR